MPRYEILSEDAMAVLDRGWRRIATEIGIEFLLDEAVEAFRAAGQQVVDGNRVILDPEFVLEQVAKAPREFEWQGGQPGQRAPNGGGEKRVAAGARGGQQGFRVGLRLPVRARGGRPPRGDDERLREPRAAVARVPGARLARRH